MSDVSGGAGWWVASDGRWYPPELHPSAREQQCGVLPPRAHATALASGAGLEHTGGSPTARYPDPGHAGGGTAPRPEQHHVGPQLPNLFQEALHGASLADNITVRYDGSDELRRAEVSSSVGHDRGRHADRNRGDDFFSASASGGSKTSTGVATRRRWRKG